MSRRPEENSAKIARHVVASQIAEAIKEFYGADALVSHTETNTGLEQVRVRLSSDVKADAGATYNVTVTRARR